MNYNNQEKHEEAVSETTTEIMDYLFRTCVTQQQDLRLCERTISVLKESSALKDASALTDMSRRRFVVLLFAVVWGCSNNSWFVSCMIVLLLTHLI